MPLIQPLCEGQEPLRTLEYASVTTATFAFSSADVNQSGADEVVLPAGEGLLITACAWTSSKWDHLRDGPMAYLRVSIGHAGDTRASSMTDEDLVDAILAELGWVIGLSTEPKEVNVTRWPDSFPQYTPGHIQWAAGVDATLAEEALGIAVAGAAYRGAWLPACVHQGRRAAHWAGEYVRSRTDQSDGDQYPRGVS